MTSHESTGSAEPVGQQGAQVDIRQRRALAVNGWLGVVVLAGCIAGTVVAAKDGTGWLWVPLVAAFRLVSSLVIVSPGQSRVVQFFGTYVGTVRRPGFWCVWPLRSAAP